jgi:hypothetical protein
MAIRIPQNQIQYRYTAGKEYMYKDTYREYQGHYYELNNQLFAGREFNSNAPILIHMPVIGNNTFNGLNSLLTKASTYVYGKISNVKINNEVPLSFFYNYDDDVRYFSYQINKKQIKEVNEDTFKTFQTNPLYVLIKLSFTSGFNEQELKEAEIKIPGITTFVNTSYTNPPLEEEGNVG